MAGSCQKLMSYIVLIVLLAGGISVWVQTFNANIVGTMCYQQQAVVPNARVTIVNEGTG
jgi:hypothetical protein